MKSFPNPTQQGVGQIARYDFMSGRRLLKVRAVAPTNSPVKKLKAFQSLICLFASMPCGQSRLIWQHTDLDQYWARPDHRQIVKVLPPGSRYDAGLLIGTRLLNLHQFTPAPAPHAKLGQYPCGMVIGDDKVILKDPKTKVHPVLIL